MKKTILICVALSMSMLFSCKKDENNNTPTSKTDLQGQWEQPALNEGTHEGVRHEMEFCSNQFKLNLHYVNDAISPEHNCSFSEWTEYAAGTYSIESNKLTLTGYYTDSDYTIKSGGCHNSGDFEASYDLNKSSSTSIQFIPSASSPSFQINLVSKTACPSVAE